MTKLEETVEEDKRFPPTSVTPLFSRKVHSVNKSSNGLHTVDLGAVKV